MNNTNPFTQTASQPFNNSSTIQESAQSGHPTSTHPHASSQSQQHLGGPYNLNSPAAFTAHHAPGVHHLSYNPFGVSAQNPTPNGPLVTNPQLNSHAGLASLLNQYQGPSLLPPATVNAPAVIAPATTTGTTATATTATARAPTASRPNRNRSMRMNARGHTINDRSADRVYQDESHRVYCLLCQEHGGIQNWSSVRKHWKKVHGGEQPSMRGRAIKDLQANGHLYVLRPVGWAWNVGGI